MDRTDRRAEREPLDPAPSGSARALPRNLGRRARWTVAGYAALAIVAVVLLAACSGGTAEEARRGEELDLARSPVLAQAQATRIAQRFFPATPSPSPSPPPLPTLGALIITVGVGQGNVPQGSYASVPADAGSVYAGAQLFNVAAGQRIEGIWTDASGTEVGRSAIEAGAGAGEQWVAFPLRLGGAIPPGEYAVYVDVNDRRLGSLAFTISPAGSGPVPLPELPSNPQAAAPTPTPRPGGQRGGGQNQPTPPPIQQGGPNQG